MVGTKLHPFYVMMHPRYKSEVLCTIINIIPNIYISDFPYLDLIVYQP